ncbi:hypothetical protein PR048_028333 [Dryococelus australis]|uniref:PiggyBac transposable element-derived protein domain-containing protein n=1 Tax=Dryococelus australis TaxID=614101 RepID=A0ABQ9GIZ4_9NEOP|nr:hypothetical protein PR048_028333 [Dryococelus australis]
MYFAGQTRVSGIAEKISRDRYRTIRNNWKLVDDDKIPDAEKKDKFWKVKPMTNMILNCCLLNPKNKNVSIDEQMTRYQIKPNPCGMKIFVVAAPDGLSLNFFFYQGRGDPFVEEDHLQSLGVGGTAVVKLTWNLPTEVSIYMDRFFTSMHLLDLLHSEA